MVVQHLIDDRKLGRPKGQARNRRCRLLAMLSVALVAGCGGTMAGEGSLMASGSDAYPHLRMVDWVTYSDAVVVFEVIAEEELTPSKDELDSGEGLIMRELEAKVVTTIWTAEGAMEIPQTFTFVAEDGRSRATRGTR